MLEHGGIVRVVNGAADCGINNSEAGLYTVKLNWNYAGKTAPVYDFPVAGINGFYSHDASIYTGSNPVDYTSATDALGRTRRYVVDITPIMALGDGGPSNPYTL